MYEVHRVDGYTDLSAMVVEEIGLHVEDILVSFVLSIFISWTLRIQGLVSLTKSLLNSQSFIIKKLR